MGKSGKRKRVVKEVPLDGPDLDRFAGSSDEEDEGRGEQDDDNDESQSIEQLPPPAPNADGIEAEAEANNTSSSDATDQQHQEEEEESDSEEEQVAAGMANAMARILGTTTASDRSPSVPVVLSKTKTPLQRQQEQEKKQLKDLKEKRKLNREKHLTALHIPLSAAASTPATGELTKELEQERLHRRIATRGVVALFNAIAQHQNKGSTEEDTVAVAKPKAAPVSKLTKHGFLNMIKSKAVSQNKATDSKTVLEDTGPKWNALRDDYMLDSDKNRDEADESEAETKWSDEEDVDKPVKVQRVG